MKNKSRVLLSVVLCCFICGVNVPVALSWDPLTDAGANLIGWYDASTTNYLTLTGTEVDAVLDRSGNNYHLTDPIPTRGVTERPIYVTNAINGLSVMWFQATYDGRSISGIPDINCTNVCIISVIEPKAAGDYPAGGYIAKTDASDSLELRGQNDGVSGKTSCTLKLDGGANVSMATANTTSFRDNIPVIMGAWYNGYNGVARLNGGVVSQTADATDSLTFTINKIQCGRQSGTPVNYQVEMVVLNTADIDTIENVEGYLAHKWALYSSLPTNHPYRYHEPGAPIPFGPLSSSNITATSADLYAEAETNLTSSTLVWDTSDKGTTNVTDWAFTNSVSGVGSTPGTISGVATGLTEDTEYFFRFYGEDASTNGWSLAYSFSTPLSALQTPEFTTVSGAYNGISLQWNDNADTETGYILQRSTNGTSFSLLTTLGPDTTNYTDGAVLTERTYYYRLAATNSVNGSGTDPSACETNGFTAIAANMIFYESFEDPDISVEGGTLPTGWELPGAAGPALSDVAMTGKTGDQFLSIGRYSDGLHTTTNAGLTNVLTANVNYTLTCDISKNQSSGANVSYIELLAGTNVIAAASNVVTTENDFSGQTSSMTFLALPDHPHIGKTLGIRLSTDWEILHSQRFYFDNLSLTATATTSDFTPPTPTNMVWVGLPTSSVSNSITMQATNAVDTNGVQYFFTNTVNGNVSGWQDSPIWSDTGLTPGVTYGYKVKARDKSANTNETNWSSEESAECESHIILYESFEDPSILPYTSVGLTATPPGPPPNWTGSGLRMHNSGTTRDTPFGEQYYYVRPNGTYASGGLGGHVLQADYTYRISYNAIAWANYDHYARAALVAGSTEVVTGSVFVAKAVTDFTAQTNLIEFIPDMTHSNLGETLTIKISGYTDFHSDSVAFDNIKVYAIPPPPAGTVFIIK